jgi:hypothetical protein
MADSTLWQTLTTAPVNCAIMALNIGIYATM